MSTQYSAHTWIIYQAEKQVVLVFKTKTVSLYGVSSLTRSVKIFTGHKRAVSHY